MLDLVRRRLEMAYNMESELLLKFIEYFPDYLLALSRTLLRIFFWTTFVETAVYLLHVILRARSIDPIPE